MSKEDPKKKCNGQSNNCCSEEQISALRKLLTHELTAEQIAVITAILTNAVAVDAIYFYRDQKVQIVLEGSLRKKTKMDKMLDQMSGLSFGEFLKSINNR